MSLSNASENQTLKMHLQGIDPAYRANATQYAALVSLAVPDEAAPIAAELTYTGYGRFPLTKASAWTDNGSNFTNAVQLLFGKRTDAGATQQAKAIVICDTASGAIAGLAAGSAAATISLSASANTGAIAWGVATGVFSVTATAQAYGLGYMVASTVDNSVMTPLSITQAVLNALAADYNAAGTIGAKINSAASGGVDYGALAAAVWASVSRTLTSGAAPTADAIADAVRIEIATELAKIMTTPTAVDNADAVWAKTLP